MDENKNNQNKTGKATFEGAYGYLDIMENLTKGLNEQTAEQVKEAKSMTERINDFIDNGILNGNIADRGIPEVKGAKDNEEENIVENTQEKRKEKEEKEETIVVKAEPMTIEEAMEKLENLIGLEEVKGKVTQLIESLEGEKILQEKSKLKLSRPNLHMIFSGPPGTGKTEVARILSNVFYALGFIKNNVLVETDRSGLVASHAGGTADKVMKKFDEAEGGILFIDEAYALANGDQYGKEAIDTVIKAMEDRRESVVVVLAGYEAEMENLLRQNPGFRSRIPNKFNFKDYNSMELTNIALAMLKGKGYDVEAIEQELKAYINLNSVNGVLEGNGRTIRNLVEAITLQHKIRIGQTKELENVKIELVTKDDIKKAISPKGEQRVGMEELIALSKKSMDELIGMEETKKEVENFLNYSIIQSKKIKQGINIPMPSLNMMLVGESGTGKTSISKNIALKLRAYGVINNGQIKEVSRGDLIGTVIGETAQKVKNVMAQSVGGVLVIDRIESLDSDDSYSREAIEVLIQELDNYRGKMAVIITGNKASLEKFMAKNPILLTKINKKIELKSYNHLDLANIVNAKIEKQIGLQLSTTSKEMIEEKLAKIMPVEENGHWADKFVEVIQIEQCNRLIEEGSENYQEYKEEDIKKALETM